MRDTSRTMGQTDKLQNKYRGPYEILEISDDGVNYVLKCEVKNVKTDSHNTVYIFRLKKSKRYDLEVEKSKNDHFLRIEALPTSIHNSNFNPASKLLERKERTFERLSVENDISVSDGAEVRTSEQIRKPVTRLIEQL